MSLWRFCSAIKNIGIPYSDVTTWYVIGSNYDYSDEALFATRLSPIQPDSPLLETLWQNAKNYILKPAASALAGFLTGGSAGAAIAGATHIAQQLVTDLERSSVQLSTGPAVRTFTLTGKCPYTEEQVLGDIGQ